MKICSASRTLCFQNPLMNICLLSHILVLLIIAVVLFCSTLLYFLYCQHSYLRKLLIGNSCQIFVV